MSTDNELPLGKKIADGLQEFTDALKSGKPVSEQLTCRKVELRLETADYDSELVKETRGFLGVSQAIFAQFIGVSTSAVRNWEQGLEGPSKVACRFMDEIRREPDRWRKRLLESAHPKTATN